MASELSVTYSYLNSYIIGEKFVKSSVQNKDDKGNACYTYGIPADVKISYAGDIYVNSSVAPEDKTHGIPVDVVVSGQQTFIQDAAKHIMASAPLIEFDDYGNLKQVPDSKAKVIAGRCVKYATMLNDALNDGGTSSDDLVAKVSALTNKVNSLSKDLVDVKKELLLNKQYVIDLKKKLQEANVKVPSFPNDVTDSTILEEWNKLNSNQENPTEGDYDIPQPKTK